MGLLEFACRENAAGSRRAAEPLPAPTESPHPFACQLETMVLSPVWSLLLHVLPEWAGLFRFKGSSPAAVALLVSEFCARRPGEVSCWEQTHGALSTRGLCRGLGAQPRGCGKAKGLKYVVRIRKGNNRISGTICRNWEFSCAGRRLWYLLSSPEPWFS